MSEFPGTSTPTTPQACKLRNIIAFTIKSLIRSHVSEQPEQFFTVAAHEAQQGHQSLAREIRALVDCHSVEPDWGVGDDKGHGTLMCGVAAFGDLTEALQSRLPAFPNGIITGKA